MSIPKSSTILIDTDTASDDAVALIMALRSSNARVIAITTVAGNVQVQQATRNALYTAELCGASTPVYQGAGKPLARSLVTADWFHGQDGLGDHGYPPPRRSAEKQHAVEAIISLVRAIQGWCWSPLALSQTLRSHWLRRQIWLTTSGAAWSWEERRVARGTSRRPPNTTCGSIRRPLAWYFAVVCRLRWLAGNYAEERQFSRRRTSSL